MPRQTKPKEAKKRSWKIPFSAKDGRLISRYSNTEYWNVITGLPEKEEIIWRESDYEFDAILQFKWISRGASADHIHFHDIITRESYMMFSSDFFDMLQQVTMSNGVVNGHWGFAKKGNSYCIQFKKPKETKE